MSAGPAAGARVAILGGGVAGIAAALRCAQAGASVTLLEVRPRLGGAAYSVQREGLTIDNGQHVFLRCCGAYRGLLADLGTEHLTRVQDRLEIPVLRPGGGVTVLRRSGARPPAHLARALLTYSPLSLRQRLAAAVAATALGRLDPDDPELDQHNFGEWLLRHRQAPRAIEALWDLIALPTLNVPAREASLALSAFVFQHGLLISAEAGDIGFHEAPLSQIIGDAALAVLAAAGVEVRLGFRAGRVIGSGAGFLVSGGQSGQEQEVPCEAAIVALPHLRAAEVLPEQAGEIAERLRRIEASPIVNLHILYDRPVTDLRFAGSLESPVQYIFDRTHAGGAPPGGQYIAVSLSGAKAEMAMSVDALRERYLPAIVQLLPRAREARVESFLITREHAATFKAAPGVASLRPGPRTPLPALAIAGAHTATDWPATLESATLSGQAAAAAVLADLGITQARSPGALAGASW